MLFWAFGFLLVAIIAGIFGFAGIASVSVDIARILFLVFLIAFAVTLLVSVFKGRRPPLL